MNKFLSVVLIGVLLMASVPVPSLAAQETFTVMLYMCGTDLESQGGMASRDLLEMVKGGIPKNGNVTLYVQTGGTKRWQASGLENRSSQRWTVSKGGVQLVENVGRADMGDQSTLTDFLQSGMSQYPADRYGLIFWDHGAGPVGGICFDEITSDYLDMAEIYSALTATSKLKNYQKFAFIGFDACLMASFEVACHLEPFADYMIASEELEPGTGWSYSDWLQVLVQDPGIDIKDLGKVIVDGFIRATLDEDPREYATLSLTDLSKLDPLKAAMGDMADALEGQLAKGNLKGISRIRQNVRSMGELFDYSSDLLDIMQFAKVYQQFDSASAKAIATAIKNAVVYSRHTNNLTDISGLTALVPYSTRSTLSQSLPHYDAYGLFPEYTKFVGGMAQSMNAGSFTFQSTNVQPENLADAQSDWDASSSSGFMGDLLDLLLSGMGGDGQGDSGYGQDNIGSLIDSTGEDADDMNIDADSSQQPSAADDSDFSLDSFLSSLFGDETNADSAADDEAWWQEETEDTGDQQPFPSANSANPFDTAQGNYAYVVSLTEDEMQHLAKAEAALLMDISDPDFECYVDLGYVQDVLVDWEKGKIYGLFDGTWPSLAGQMVCIYDQIANDHYMRSLIPVTINEEEQYLLVVFDDKHPSGQVMGYTEGYTDSGMPARGYTELMPGDVVIPQYDLLYWDDQGAQQTEPFAGDAITVGPDGSIAFAYAQVESDAKYSYGFCLNDIFGDYQYTDFISLDF